MIREWYLRPFLNLLYLVFLLFLAATGTCPVLPINICPLFRTELATRSVPLTYKALLFERLESDILPHVIEFVPAFNDSFKTNTVGLNAATSVLPTVTPIPVVDTVSRKRPVDESL